MRKAIGCLKLTVLLALAALCLLSPVYAMGSAPPASTQEAGTAPAASDEALAKEQVDNLKNISINSKDVNEAYEKFVRQVMGGKRYLWQFNDLAKKQLIKDVMDKEQDWKYRWAIISSLNPDNPPEMFDVRRRILEDKSEKMELRRIAIVRLSDTKREDKNQEAVTALINALRDDDWDIVASAANGLGQLKDRRAVEPLIGSVERTRGHLDDLIKNGWKGYMHGTQLEEAALSCSIRALGEIGDKKAVPVLLDLLKDPYLEAIVELNDGTKGWAARALRNINDKSAIVPLKEYLKTTRDFRVGGAVSDAIKKLEENGK